MERLHNYVYGEPVRVQTDQKPLETIWNYREELAIEDGLIFKAHRLVIPTSQRAERSSSRTLRRGENSAKSTRDSVLARNL